MSKRQLPMMDRKARRAAKREAEHAAWRAIDDTIAVGDLATYDWIVISTSAGKDSLAMLDYVAELCRQRGVDPARIVVVHSDLGRMEWKGTKALAKRQAERYGFRFEVTSRIGEVSSGRYNKTKTKAPLYERGERYGDLLDQVLRRRKQLLANGKDAPAWPSMASRWCTSDFKRGPIGRVVTTLKLEWRNANRAEAKRRPCRVLDCIGLRAQESDKRAEEHWFHVRKSNKQIHVDTWLPIKWWTLGQVWERIFDKDLEYHPAYDLGMPRLSCVFCVFASKAALLIAGQHNPELLADYVAVEREVGWDFKKGLALADIQAALESGERAATAEDWAA